jgi:hypothetical protein
MYNNPVCKRPVALLYVNCLYITQSVNSATNCSFFLLLSLSTHVSAPNGHLQVSHYTKLLHCTNIIHSSHIRLHAS